MKASTQLRLKALAAGIHKNQIPLDRKESQKLLNVLNSSFRKQLDLVHPLNEDSNTSDKPSSELPNSAPEIEPSIQTYSSQASATNLLENILSSPLFASDASEFKPGKRKPTFRVAVARGQANLDIARKFLQNLGLHPSDWAQDGKFSIQKKKAATGVTHWLWSSGAVDSASFYEDRELQLMIIAGLVAEDRPDVIGRWLLFLPPGLREATSEKDPSKLSALQRDNMDMKRHMLRSYIRAISNFHANINQSLEGFHAILQQFHSDPQQLAVQCQALGHNGAYLTQKIFSRTGFILTKQATRPNAGVDPDLYDSWIRTVLKWSHYRLLLREHCMSLLKLHHPLHPTSKPALDYLTKVFANKTLLDNLPHNAQRDIFGLSTKTAYHLVTLERMPEAERLVRKIESAFPEFIPTEEKDEKVRSSNSISAQSTFAAVRSLLLPT